MWTAIASIITWLLGLLTPSAPDPVAQGEKLGKAEQSNADAQAELKNVQAAQEARQSVRDTAVRDPSGLRQPDEFSRD